MVTIIVFNLKFWRCILLGERRKVILSEEKVVPKEDDLNYDKLKTKNALVKSKIINFRKHKLMSHFVQCDTAKDVWDVVRKIYLDVSDSLQVYKLIKRPSQLRQGGRPLIE